MEHESNTMGLCRSGCGFYGNPATDGLCSLCFKEALKKKQQPPSSAPSPSSPSANSSSVNVVEAARNSVMESMSTAQPTVPPCLSPNAPATSTEPAKISEEAEANEAVGGASSAASAEQQQSADNSADENKDAKKKKNRCAMCRKKVGLTGFECRCGGLFCGVHRYSDKHDCTFDYREMGAQEIRRNNPVVVGEKMQKI